jgi:glycosyltransferase involved in cell wall biosynthesis
MALRVLFVNPLGELGGSERSLLDAMSSLLSLADPVEVKLLLLAEGELGVRARALGIDVSVLPLPKPLAELGESSADGTGPRALARTALRTLAYTPGYALDFRRRVLELAPSVLHTNGMKAHLLAASCFRRLPLVAHLRDFPSQRPISRFALPLLARPRALIVTNSRAVEADTLRARPNLATRVVYNGIDVNEFRPGPRDLDALARLAGLPSPAADTLVIGLVATYAWWKGHHLFLEAARRLLEQTERPLRFYVVGGPIYGIERSELSVAALRTLLTQNGLSDHVGLVPFQRDAADVYRGLDVVVHASTRAEPFGRTIVEGMATGRAVVVARAGGAAELYTERESGVGYEPGNVDELVRAVLELANDPELRARLGAGARAEAVERFDRSRLGTELFASYRELLQGFA